MKKAKFSRWSILLMPILAPVCMAASNDQAVLVSRIWTGVDYSNIRSEEVDSNNKLFDEPELFMALQTTALLIGQKDESSIKWLQPEEVQLMLKFSKAAIKPKEGEEAKSDNGLPSPDKSFITDANAVSVYAGGLWYVNHYNFHDYIEFKDATKFTIYGRLEGGAVINTEDSDELYQDHFAGIGLKIESSYEVYAEAGYNRDEKYVGEEDRFSLRGAWLYRGADSEVKAKEDNYANALKWVGGITFSFSGSLDNNGQDETVVALFLSRDMDDVVKSILGLSGGKEKK